MTTTPERMCALIAGIYLPSTIKFWYRLGPSDSYTEVDMANEYGDSWAYPFDGLGAASFVDLAYALVYMLQDYEGLDFTATLNKTLGPGYGCLTWTKGASVGSYLEISSRSNGVTQNLGHSDEMFAVLFPDRARAGLYSVIFDGAGDVEVTNSRPCLGVVMPRAYLFSDIVAREWRTSADSDWAAQNRLRVSRVMEARVGIRLTNAYPRGVAEGEYHQLQDFLDMAASGAKVVIFADVLAAQVRRMSLVASYGDPYGFLTGYLRKASADWEPEALDDRREARWERELSFILPMYENSIGTAFGYELGVQSSDIE